MFPEIPQFLFLSCALTFAPKQEASRLNVRFRPALRRRRASNRGITSVGARAAFPLQRGLRPAFPQTAPKRWPRGPSRGPPERGHFLTGTLTWMWVPLPHPVPPPNPSSLALPHLRGSHPPSCTACWEGTTWPPHTPCHLPLPPVLYFASIFICRSIVV